MVRTYLRPSSRARSLAMLSKDTVLFTVVIASLPLPTRNVSQNLRNFVLIENSSLSESVIVWVGLESGFRVRIPSYSAYSKNQFRNRQHATLFRNIMRGYHIRITVERKTEISQSHPPVVDTFIPRSIFEHLPSQPAKSTSRRNATFNPAHRDYRFGPIRLDWIDFENMSAYASKTNQNIRGMHHQQ